MGRKRRRSELSGRQVIQVQQMFQNLLVGLDTAEVQRLLEARDVLVALADGRLTPQKALASLGMPVTIGDGKAVTMDFFGLRAGAGRREVIQAFRRQGLRPASIAEYERFRDQHPETIHDVIVRRRRNLVVMGERVRAASWKPRGSYWAYATFSRDADGAIVRYDESIDDIWDKTHRFLGVRMDERPESTEMPIVSLRHVSPKVRPTA